MKRRRTKTAVMFPAGDDLPLFSGTCQRAEASPYQPAERAGEQAKLPGIETRPEMSTSSLTFFTVGQEVEVMTGPRAGSVGRISQATPEGYWLYHFVERFSADQLKVF